MRKLSLLLIMTWFISVSSLLLFACKKQSKNESEISTIETLNSIPPTTIPAIQSNIELYSQLKHLAAGYAAIFENPMVNQFGRDNLLDLLTTNIPNKENELPIGSYHIIVSILTAGEPDRFSINGNAPSSPNSSDLFDAITFCKSTYTPTPNINLNWMTNFYQYFDVGTEKFFTLLRIPEFADQGLHPTNASIPIIFLAENVVGATTFDGYSWDKSNNSIKVIAGLNDDIIEDHIDNHTAYIIVVGFDKINEGTAGGRISSSCEGGFSCTDNYCDQKCGEPETCLDCQSQNNKKLFIFKVRIDNDERVSKGGSPTVIDNYFVDNLGGKYKLTLNSVVLHANGKWDAINSEDIRPKWSQSEVHRVRYKKNGSRSKGTNTMKIVWLKGDNQAEQAQKGILLAENFNPREASIFLSLYEEDLFGAKRDILPPTFRNLGISNDQNWRSWGMPTLCGPAKANFYHDDLRNPKGFQTLDAMLEVKPSDWIDPNNPSVLLDEITVKSLNATFVLRFE